MAGHGFEDSQKLLEFTSTPEDRKIIVLSLLQRQLLKEQQTKAQDEQSYGPSLQQYEYSSLPPQSIRVLKVYPYGYSPYEPLVVSLHVIPLDGSVPFDTLSYTWGPPSLTAEDAAAAQIFTQVPRTYPVWCGSSLLQVTRNLRDALWRIRELHADPDAQARFKSLRGVSLTSHVWIDELCINQVDEVEQGEQVSLMGEIYSKANLVLAWLGEQEQHTRYGLELLRQLEHVIYETRDEHVKSASFHDDGFWRRARRKPLESKEWCAVIDIMARKWFTRAWVIQEVALASTHPVCLCGTTAFPIVGIFKVISFLISAGWSNSISLDVEANYSPDHFTYIQRLLAFHPFEWLGNIQRRTAQRQHHSFHMLQAYTFPSTSCLKAQDKVYASMALASEFALNDTPFHVDYKESAADTYIRASKHSLEVSRSLDLLSIVAHLDRVRYSEDLQHLPSWCPNYADMDFPDGRPQPIDLHPDKERMPDSFAASGRSQYTLADTASKSRLLEVRGVLCGQVMEVVNASIGTKLEELSTHIEFLPRITPSTSAPVSEMFWRTLVHDKYAADSGGPPHPASPETKDYFFAFLYVLINHDLLWGRHLASPVREQLQRMAASITQLQRLDPFANEVFPNLTHYLGLDAEVLADASFWEKDRAKYSLAGNSASATSLVYNYTAKGRSRRFFRTDDQRLGMGMQTMRAGDQIWLLAGGRVPYILRPLENGHYEFHGEAYVHGIMMGEAWPGHEDVLADVVLE